MNWSATRWVLVAGLFVIAAFLAVLLYFEGRKAYWDSKVADMCEKEGGVKVYKQVKLDANEYTALLNRQSQLDLPSEHLLHQTRSMCIRRKSNTSFVIS